MGKNIKNKKGFGLLGDETAGLLFGAIILLMLISLLVLIYRGSGSQSVTAHQQEELNEINNVLKTLTTEGEIKEYNILHTRQWYMFTSEYGDICEGRFCLCVCEKEDCSTEARACISTQKFVLLRQNGMEARIMKLENPPVNIKLSLVNQSVYPLNVGKEVDRGWIVTGTTTPLLLKFADQWLWSPDLETWLDMATSSPSNGRWAGRTIRQENHEFMINVLAPVQNSKEKGETRIVQFGAKLSEGIYVISQP